MDINEEHSGGDSTSADGNAHLLSSWRVSSLVLSHLILMTAQEARYVTIFAVKMFRVTQLGGGRGRTQAGF